MCRIALIVAFEAINRVRAAEVVVLSKWKFQMFEIININVQLGIA